MSVKNTAGRHSAIDGRTTSHSGHAVSQCIRKTRRGSFRLGQGRGWARKMRHRELPNVGWQFTLALGACNLHRLPKLLLEPPP
jgi:hypothetical protein